MKTKTLIISIIAGLTLLASCGQSPKGSADLSFTKGQVDSVSYLLGINFGSFIKGYNFGDDINYSEVMKGLKDFANAEGNMRDPEFGNQFKISPDELNDVFNSFLEKRRQIVLAENKAKEDAFLEANRKKADVRETASGLQYRIIAPGNNVKPGPQDKVLVHYKGTLLDGTVFDQTQEGGDPIELPLNGVIPGWREGLQLVGEGGDIELFIPAALAYGESGNQAIEPNSTLIFRVQVAEVHPAEAD